MTQNVDTDSLIPFWALESVSNYRFEVLPLWFSSSSANIWNRWQQGTHIPGCWCRLSVIPAEVMQAVETWMNGAPGRNRFCEDKYLTDSFLAWLDKELGPKGYRFQLKRIGESMDEGLMFRGHHRFRHYWDSALIVSAWIKGRDAADVRLLAGSGESVAITPIAPHSHFRYWAVELEGNGCPKLALLETRGSVQLTSEGKVSVWAYGQRHELDYRVPGLRIDPNWQKLPTVLAMTIWDGRFFRAYQGSEPRDLPLSGGGEWE